jgi:hypothetical protein
MKQFLPLALLALGACKEGLAPTPINMQILQDIELRNANNQAATFLPGQKADSTVAYNRADETLTLTMNGESFVFENVDWSPARNTIKTDFKDSAQGMNCGERYAVEGKREDITNPCEETKTKRVEKRACTIIKKKTVRGCFADECGRLKKGKKRITVEIPGVQEVEITEKRKTYEFTGRIFTECRGDVAVGSGVYTDVSVDEDASRCKPLDPCEDDEVNPAPPKCEQKGKGDSKLGFLKILSVEELE